MHTAHDPGEHSGITHPGVEDPQRRRMWSQIGEFPSCPSGHGRFFVAGVDEGQVFLAVVIKSERRRCISPTRTYFHFSSHAVHRDTRLLPFDAWRCELPIRVARSQIPRATQLLRRRVVAADEHVVPG
jgi:hypothetical protein